MTQVASVRAARARDGKPRFGCPGNDNRQHKRIVTTPPGRTDLPAQTVPKIAPRQPGIAAHLGLACAAVAAFALMANFLVEQRTLLIHTTEIRPVVTPVAIPEPSVTPVPVVIEPIDLVSAIERFGRAVLDRVEDPSQERQRHMRAAAKAMRKEAAEYVAAVRPHVSASKVRSLNDATDRHEAQAAELVRIADARQALLQKCRDHFESLDARLKSTLDRSWKVFGRVVARRSLIEISHHLDELRKDLSSFTTPRGYDEADVAAIIAHEAALLQSLQRYAHSLSGSQGADWVQQNNDDARRLIAARESLLEVDEQRIRAMERFRAANAALAASAGEAVTPTRELAGTSIPAAPPAASDAAAAGALQASTISTTSERRDKPGQRAAFAWVSIGVLVLLLAVSGTIFIRIVGPVRRLMLASRRIADGDADIRVARGGIKELDSLAVSFNQMAERLGAAQRVTREYQGQLEARVEERTRQLLHLAEHDPLTELPNRRQLFAQLTTALRRAEAENRCVGVYFLDLDNFKNLNDSIGHAYGDRVLQSVAHRLEEVAAPYGFSARLGGDEFTVVVERADSTEQIRDAGVALVRAFQEPLPVDGRDLLMSISIGVSYYPMHAEDAESLLRAADAALFRAKALGRSQLNVFSPELLTAAATRFSTEQGLRRAVERDELELVFQPEVHGQTLEVALVEALLRWRLPDGRLASPAEFLAVAEESGLIIEISDWVLRAAIEAAARWHHGDWPAARVAINASARQVLDTQFVRRVQGLLQEHRLPARCIEIELTENVLQTGRATVDAVRQLREFGIGIALDDFGTGYSSLASLERLPLTRVKLDQSLIASIDTNERSLVIAQAIADLCGNLGLEMTAEGIERPEQLAPLLRHRSTYLQGYLLSRPVHGQAVLACIKDVPARLHAMLLADPALRPAPAEASGRSARPRLVRSS
jgi:diguanylate cyclase (GGDEF)-like protein